MAKRGGDAAINNRNRRIFLFAFFLIYIFTVLWFTILKRSTGYHVAQFELFWSYKKWFAGDADLGNEIMANIAMFIPFGFLIPSILPINLKWRRKATAVIVGAIIFSLTIIDLQLKLTQVLRGKLTHLSGGVVSK